MNRRVEFVIVEQKPVGVDVAEGQAVAEPVIEMPGMTDQPAAGAPAPAKNPVAPASAPADAPLFEIGGDYAGCSPSATPLRS